jgi:hypothetical protein
MQTEASRKESLWFLLSIEVASQGTKQGRWGEQNN